MIGTMRDIQEIGNREWNRVRRIYKSLHEAFQDEQFNSPSSKLEASVTDKKLGFSTTSHVIWLSFRPNIK